jgi:hypothetical protein
MLKGNNPNVRPEPPKFDKPPTDTAPVSGIVARGGFTLRQPIVLDGVLPVSIPQRRSLQIVAALPDGRVEPLVWLYEYRTAYKHPFLFRRPLALPAGTVIRGLPATASIRLLTP